MTEKQGIYYRRCIDLGTISAAAEELFVSRSVISRMISELEAEFETKLVDRKKQGVFPTAAGTMLYNTIGQMQELKSKLKEDIKKL